MSSVLHNGWLAAVRDIADTPAPPTGSAATAAVHTSTTPTRAPRRAACSATSTRIRADRLRGITPATESGHDHRGSAAASAGTRRPSQHTAREGRRDRSRLTRQGRSGRGEEQETGAGEIDEPSHQRRRVVQLEGPTGFHGLL